MKRNCIAGVYCKYRKSYFTSTTAINKKERFHNIRGALGQKERWCSHKHVTLIVCVIKRTLYKSLPFTVYISLYYVAFYVVMTSLFSLSIWTLMYTLDPYAPDYQDRLQSPGNIMTTRTTTTLIKPQWLLTSSLFACLFRGDGVAGHVRRGRNRNHLQHIRQGQLDENVQHPSWVPGTLVFVLTWPRWTNIKQDERFKTRYLNLWFCLSPSAYNETKQLDCNYCNCTKGKYFIQTAFSAPHHTKWACRFAQSMLGACSGFEDPTFGYNCTMPCVIIKMNRVSS